MIKSIIKYIILNLSIIFLVTCTPEDILEELTGQEVLWLCPDSNAAYDDASFCNSLCSDPCTGYNADEIPLSWTYYCEDLDTYYDTMQSCQTVCPNSCIVETNS